MERRWPADRDRRRFRGGNLAVSAITSSAPKLRSLVRAAVLFYGAYDLAATAERNRSLPGLQEQLNTYVSGKRDLFDDPRVSPLKAVAPGILPPCFIVGAGDDSWCLADSLALAQALSAVASPYELHVMEGIPHGFLISELIIDPTGFLAAFVQPGFWAGQILFAFRSQLSLKGLVASRLWSTAFV